MSYLLSDLCTRVQDKLDDNSFDTGILTEFANDTEREIFNRYRINTAEHQIDTITTTAGSINLTGLPTNPPVAQYIELFINAPINYSRVIPYVEYEDADVYYPNYKLLGMSQPLAWYVFDGTPTLLNEADKVYTISAKYTILPTKLLALSDSPNIPEEFSEATVLGMYARALEFNDEFDKSPAVRQQYMQLCNDYVDATRRQAGTPHIMRRIRTVNRDIFQR